VSVRRLTLACGDYDRTAGLAGDAGNLSADGLALHVLRLPPEEIFYRMLRYREFDAAEMSLSSYVASLGSGGGELVALPAFLSRAFRHGSIFVNRERGVVRPCDLIGARVGVPEYEMTAAVWIRGILADQFGVPVNGPRYWTGGLEEPGRTAKSALRLPAGVNVRAIPPGASLNRMLAEGEIDALYTARAPSAFVAGDPRVARLFPDYAAQERRYFADTGVFPIMHTVVLRRDVYERDRWLARELAKLLERARDRAVERLRATVALAVTLPWLPQHVEETVELMGSQFWPYGVERNRQALTRFLRYAREQGITDQALAPEDLFAPETLTAAKV
jgi:4,5-dihydroxyphthalate decarboxylase